VMPMPMVDGRISRRYRRGGRGGDGVGELPAIVTVGCDDGRTVH